MNFQTVGMLILLGVLVYLWLVVHRLGRTVHQLERRPLPSVSTPPAPAVPNTPAAPTPVAEAADAGVIAAIAAAVAVVVRRPYRIVTIQPDTGAQLAWSAEGRRAIYLSHRIR